MKVYPHNFNDSSLDTLNNGCYIYLHGKIEEIVGYDIIDRIDPIPREDGIYLVEVVFNNTAYECTMYIWNLKTRVRGLVVLNDDEESKKYAKICYDSKVEYL